MNDSTPPAVSGDPVTGDVMAAEIGVYAVGLLHDWKIARRTGEWRSRWRWFCRSWRRRSYWNGYLAEPLHWPEGIGLTRCGSGWTRARAERDLRRRWARALRSSVGAS